MEIFGDYHTHTVYSHGKGSVEDNVARAESIGLKEVAITDHGFRHVTYNVRRLDVPSLIEDVNSARAKHPNIRVYLGVESNITGVNGSIDIKPSDFDFLDICIAGYHKFIIPNKVSAVFSHYLPALFVAKERSSPSRIAKNTDMYINAIVKNNIDVLTHINLGLMSDSVEVAKCCKQYGTFLELNGKGISLTDDELEKIAATGVTFIVNSDAHSLVKIGLDTHQLEMARRVGIKDDQIANVGKIPRFRSRIARGLD